MSAVTSVDARAGGSRRRGQHVQPVAQHRLERRHFRLQRAADHLTEVNHADISTNVTAVNRGFENPAVTQFLSPFTAAGRAALDAVVTQQAQVIAYIDDYKLLLIATLALFGLLVIFKKSSGSAGATRRCRGLMA